MDEVDALLNDRPTPDGAMLPSLRIAHLMLWTAVAAVLLAIEGPAGGSEAQVPQLYAGAWLASRVFNAAIVAAAITATLLGVLWRRRGLAYFDQPGQWLLLVLSVAGAGQIARDAAYQRIISSGGSVSGTVEITVFGIGLLVSLVLVVLCTWIGWRRSEGAWRLLFFWRAITAVASSSPFYMILYWWLPYRQAVMLQLPIYVGQVAVGLLLLSWAVWADRRLGKPRHWTHFLGVALSYAASLLTLVMILAWMLFS